MIRMFSGVNGSPTGMDRTACAERRNTKFAYSLGARVIDAPERRGGGTCVSDQTAKLMRLEISSIVNEEPLHLENRPFNQNPRQSSYAKRRADNQWKLQPARSECGHRCTD